VRAGRAPAVTVGCSLIGEEVRAACSLSGEGATINGSLVGGGVAGRGSLNGERAGVGSRRGGGRGGGVGKGGAMVCVVFSLCAELPGGGGASGMGQAMA
jgi:hypothetical protein